MKNIKIVIIICVMKICDINIYVIHSFYVYCDILMYTYVICCICMSMPCILLSETRFYKKHRRQRDSPHLRQICT